MYRCKGPALSQFWLIQRTIPVMELPVGSPGLNTAWQFNFFLCPSLSPSLFQDVTHESSPQSKNVNIFFEVLSPILRTLRVLMVDSSISLAAQSFFFFLPPIFFSLIISTILSFFTFYYYFLVFFFYKLLCPNYTFLTALFINSLYFSHQFTSYNNWPPG